MLKSAVFYGNLFIGEVEIYPQNSKTFTGIREIRISYLSSPSERCPPLAVLHTVSSGGVWVKVEVKLPLADESPLLAIHAACIRENKTAVVPVGEEELHLVAMASRKNHISNACFWGFRVRQGLYESSLSMLNLRCLNIVFDLDETLVVANTMRSFEDRIEALQKKVSNEPDPQRAAGMLAEIKRYQDDKFTLKQYAESDQVVENGKVFKVQPEIVPPLSGNNQLVTRPVIRLPERNIILTRVNPSIRDTSVLVRLRPAWEELRSYLTAKGRKRFEVYVCTMAERDYALEMWRLLDPDFSLISSSTLLDRIVCVKSGSRKSLLNVFQGGICHPKMALVIDDRLKVWDEMDQPRVHVVPAFAPYYAPQAEANSNIPILCVARNVACNVRGGFFKDFDDGILPQISEVFYEDEPEALPIAPDVGNYLVSEDDALTSAVNKNQPFLEVKVDADPERRLMTASGPVQVVQPVLTNLRPAPLASLQHLVASSSGTPMQTASAMAVSLPDKQSVSLFKPLGQLAYHEPNHHVPISEEGEVQDSEIDPDTRRRLLILQHGQDMRDPTPPIPVRPPVPASVTPVQPPGNWFEEDFNSRKPMVSKEFNVEPETTFFDKKRSQHQPNFRSTDNYINSDRGFHKNWRMPMQSNYGVDSMRPNHVAAKYTSLQGVETPTIQDSAGYKNAQVETAKGYSQQAESQEILLQIAMKCGAKVEYRSSLCDSAELQFLIEVWFVGEKIGQGVGKTRREAQHRAAEIALQSLAEKYLSNAQTGSDHSHGEFLKLSQTKQNGFTSNSNLHRYQLYPRNDNLPVASTSEESRYMDRQSASITALKELCTVEGFNLIFHPPSTPTGSAGKGEVLAQVEVAGQIVGKGFAATWEDAKIQAAEEALGTLRSMLGQFTQKHATSPRSLSAIPPKRLKPDYSWSLQRTQPSDRYSKSEALVP